MVDEEDVRFLGHEVRGEDEASTASILKRFDLEVRAAVKGLRGQFLKQLTMKRLGKSRGSEEQTVDFEEILKGLDSFAVCHFSK